MSSAASRRRSAVRARSASGGKAAVRDGDASITELSPFAGESTLADPDADALRRLSIEESIRREGQEHQHQHQHQLACTPTRRFLAQGYDALVAGNDTQAVEAFGQALAEHSDRLTVRSLALAHDRAGYAADGRRVLERWLIDHVDDDETRTLLANLYLANDDYGDALPHLERLVKAKPTDFAALNNLAWSYVRQGDPREALPLAERAYALAGSDPRIMDTLGWVLVQSGNSERAIPLLERAAYGESGSSETLLHLAQAHFENDDLTSARAVLKTIKQARDAAKVQFAADALLRAIDR